MRRRPSSIVSLRGSPLEHDEHKGLIDLCKMMEPKYPALELIYANPNAGKRTQWEIGRLKAEGWKAGIPDISLPIARRNYNGLFLELKRADGNASDLSAEQAWWLARLAEQGYRATWQPGAVKAWQEIEWYLS